MQGHAKELAHTEMAVSVYLGRVLELELRGRDGGQSKERELRKRPSKVGTPLAECISCPRSCVQINITWCNTYGTYIASLTECSSHAYGAYSHQESAKILYFYDKTG